MDGSGNILLPKIQINGWYATIDSIYRPKEDNPEFFEQIKTNLRILISDYEVIGRDWNTTLDARNSRVNIDTLNTASIPSARRSALLDELFTEHKLVDP
jgi:hypothetical protein